VIEEKNVEVVFPPCGFVFELVYRCRGVPFLEGSFGQIAFIDGEAWAVGFRSGGGDREPARWWPLDLNGVREIALGRTRQQPE
jgi:hypothetical protein